MTDSKPTARDEAFDNTGPALLAERIRTGTEPGPRWWWDMACDWMDGQAAVPVPEPEAWFWARNRDDESWSGPESSREHAIACAREELARDDPEGVAYVVLGHRAETIEFAAYFDAERMLADMVDYGSDNGLLGPDIELEFVDDAACEREVRAVLAKHLKRPNWYECDGSAAEEVRLVPEPPTERKAER